MSLNHSLLRRRRLRQISASSEACESRSLLSANPMMLPEAHRDSPEAPIESFDHPPSSDPSAPGVFSDCVTIAMDTEDIGPSDDLFAVTYLVDESPLAPDMELETVGPPVDDWDPSWIYYASIFESGPAPGDPFDFASEELGPTNEAPLEFHSGPLMTTPPDVFPTTMESPDESFPGGSGPGTDGLLSPEGWHPLMERVLAGPGFDPESLVLPPEGFLVPGLCPGPEGSSIDQMSPDETYFDPESKPDANPDREAFPEYFDTSFPGLDQPFDDSWQFSVNQMWDTELLPDDPVQPKDDPHSPTEDVLPEMAYLTSISEDAEMLFAEEDYSGINPLPRNVELSDAVPVTHFARSVPDLGDDFTLNNSQTFFTMSDSFELEASGEELAVMSSEVRITSGHEIDATEQLMTVGQIMTVNQWIPRRMNSLFHSMSTPSASGLTKEIAEQQSRSRATDSAERSDADPVRSGGSTTSSVASQRSMAQRRLSASPLSDSLMSDSLTETQLSDGQQSEDLSESDERQSQQRTDSPTSGSQPVKSDKAAAPQNGASSPADQSLSRHRITPTGTQRQIDHFMSQFAQDSFVG
jgi:hypothetical protein